MMRFFYNWVLLPILWIVLKIKSRSDEKIRESLNGKDGACERIDKALTTRDMSKKLIWFHAVSAGEYLQAEPILHRCLEAGFQCGITVGSVNGYKWVKKKKFPQGGSPLFVDYIPFDFLENARRLLAIIQPDAIVFSKFDLWPNIVWQAYQRNIPTFLISATLQPKSMRITTKLGRMLFGEVYQELKGIFTVTEDDRKRFEITNRNHPNILSLGDTRFDSVLDRANQVELPHLPKSFEGKFVFIVGSCWPPDEEKIVGPLVQALRDYSDLVVIVAPHEPSEAHLVPIERRFAEFNPSRLSKSSLIARLG